MAASKRQTTMAKLQREQAVREKRVRKAERKDERKRAAAEAALSPDGGTEGEADADDVAAPTAAE